MSQRFMGNIDSYNETVCPDRTDMSSSIQGRVELLPVPDVLYAILLNRQELMELSGIWNALRKDRSEVLRKAVQGWTPRGSFIALVLGNCKTVLRRLFSLGTGSSPDEKLVCVGDGSEVYPLACVLERHPNEKEWQDATSELAQRWLDDESERLTVHQLKLATVRLAWLDLSSRLIRAAEALDAGVRQELLATVAETTIDTTFVEGICSRWHWDPVVAERIARLGTAREQQEPEQQQAHQPQQQSQDQQRVESHNGRFGSLPCSTAGSGAVDGALRAPEANGHDAHMADPSGGEVAAERLRAASQAASEPHPQRSETARVCESHPQQQPCLPLHPQSLTQTQPLGDHVKLEAGGGGNEFGAGAGQPGHEAAPGPQSHHPPAADVNGTLVQPPMALGPKPVGAAACTARDGGDGNGHGGENGATCLPGGSLGRPDQSLDRIKSTLPSRSASPSRAQHSRGHWDAGGDGGGGKYELEPDKYQSQARPNDPNHHHHSGSAGRGPDRDLAEARGGMRGTSGGERVDGGGGFGRMDAAVSWSMERWSEQVYDFIVRAGGVMPAGKLRSAGLGVPHEVLIRSRTSVAAFFKGFPHLWTVPSTSKRLILMAVTAPQLANRPDPSPHGKEGRVAEDGAGGDVGTSRLGKEVLGEGRGIRSSEGDPGVGGEDCGEDMDVDMLLSDAEGDETWSCGGRAPVEGGGGAALGVGCVSELGSGRGPVQQQPQSKLELEEQQPQTQTQCQQPVEEEEVHEEELMRLLEADEEMEVLDYGAEDEEEEQTEGCARDLQSGRKRGYQSGPDEDLDVCRPRAQPRLQRQDVELEVGRRLDGPGGPEGGRFFETKFGDLGGPKEASLLEPAYDCDDAVPVAVSGVMKPPEHGHVHDGACWSEPRTMSSFAAAALATARSMLEELQKASRCNGGGGNDDIGNSGGGDGGGHPTAQQDVAMSHAWRSSCADVDMLGNPIRHPNLLHHEHSMDPPSSWERLAGGGAPSGRSRSQTRSPRPRPKGFGAWKRSEWSQQVYSFLLENGGRADTAALFRAGLQVPQQVLAQCGRGPMSYLRKFKDLWHVEEVETQTRDGSFKRTFVCVVAKRHAATDVGTAAPAPASTDHPKGSQQGPAWELLEAMNGHGASRGGRGGPKRGPSRAQSGGRGRRERGGRRPSPGSGGRGGWEGSSIDREEEWNEGVGQGWDGGGSEPHAAPRGGEGQPVRERQYGGGSGRGEGAPHQPAEEAEYVQRLCTALRGRPDGLPLTSLTRVGLRIPESVLRGLNATQWVKRYSHLWTISEHPFVLKIKLGIAAT